MRDYFKRVRCKGRLARRQVKNGSARAIAKKMVEKEG